VPVFESNFAAAVSHIRRAVRRDVTRQMASQLIAHGIVVSAIAPGALASDIARRLPALRVHGK